MFFLGSGIAAYKGCLDNTSVTSDTIDNLSVGGAVFDRVFVTRAVVDQPTDFPGWDYDTILDAPFNGNLMAVILFTRFSRFPRYESSGADPAHMTG